MRGCTEFGRFWGAAKAFLMAELDNLMAELDNFVAELDNFVAELDNFNVKNTL